MTRLVLAICFTALISTFLPGCSGHSYIEDETTESGLTPELFNRIIAGDTTALYTLRSDCGMEVCITNYGARIVSLAVPGRDGDLRDVILGADSVAAYIAAPMNEIGALMGRYGGILSHRPSAKSNEWMNRTFKVDDISHRSLTLSLQSDSTADGMPGNVAAQVTYTLTDECALEVTITAITDAPTHLDIAPRIFFNLDGTDTDSLTSIADHRLQLTANQYLFRDSLGSYPGDMLMTIWTNFDFSKEKSFKRVFNSNFYQVRWRDGIDNYFVQPGYGEGMEEMLKLYSPASGIEMSVSGSYPGVDIYTCNAFDGSLRGKHGTPYPRRCAVAIMPHYYPDAPNRPGWGMDAKLRPGQVMHEKIIYRFSVRED